MKTGKSVRRILATAALLTCGASHAAYTAYAYQNGPNVEIRGSGSINLAALAFIGDSGADPQIEPSRGLVILGPYLGAFGIYSGVTGPASIGPGLVHLASGGSGNASGIAGGLGVLLVPSGYVSGSASSAAAVWNGNTIAGLGMTPGTYKWTWGTGPTADSYTLVIGSRPPAAPSSIPTLSEWGVIIMSAIMGVVGLIAARRRRTAATD